MNGRLDLNTGDGSIRATDVAGELTLHTGDGSVTVDGAEGRLDLDTGDGSVNVTGKLTGVQLHTGDGSIVYRAQPGHRDDGRLGDHDGRRRRVALPAVGLRCGARRAHRRRHASATTSTSQSGGQGEVSRRTVRGRIGAGGRQLRIRTGDGAHSPARRPRRSESLITNPNPNRTILAGLAAFRDSTIRDSIEVGISDCVVRRIRHPRLSKRIPALPALAAPAAVHAALRLHARQRELERHAQRAAQRDDVGLVQRRERRLDGDRRRRGRARARAPSRRRTPAVASGNGLPASGPISTREIPARAMKTAAFDSSTMLRPSM